MQDLLFYIFAGLTLLCGLLVVANPFSRNPVTSAMFLVLTIISMSGLFVLLHAFFLAAVQVLVYAGAVIVLFLFVIMLLDVQAEEERKIKKAGAVLGLAAVGLLGFVFIRSIVTSPIVAPGVEPEVVGTTFALGSRLFTEFLLPFEIMSVLLLAAMIGVILLGKKDLR